MIGTRAPDFDLPIARVSGDKRQRAALADYRDRWLILMFYPRDFSLVCPTELTSLSLRYDEFLNRDCDLLGISTDSVETHERWITSPRSQGGLGGLRFPLAADEQGAVCQAYGVYVPRQHLAMRGLFIIDPNGVLQYQVVQNLSVGRSSDEVLRVLDALQTGGLCPEGWQRDKATLDAAAVLGPGSVVGQYRIDAKLGAGSFGTVYRARDLTLDRTVALKVVHSSNQSLAASLLNEARAAAALNHPNVCTLYSVDASDGISMIVMEHVAGRPLAKILEHSALSAQRAATIARQVAAGMAAAHGHGVVHGDLKPANVMVSDDDLTKIMDFGLARRAAAQSATSDTVSWSPSPSGGISGTPSYMSPEQARGEPVTAASDVFSLGLMVYEMVTGQRAIHGRNIFEVLRQIDQLDGQRLAASLPDPFRRIISHSLTHDARQRILTMADIAATLA
jgi:alkyl hydroperoxide reductase subunit AhpC/tRNA A-37 threonylcarbamoyl transferase component Bud32